MRSRNAIILSTISLAALMSTPAYAQAVGGAPVDSTPEKQAEGDAAQATTSPTNADGQPAATTTPSAGSGAIVVTGSRIRRNNFSTPQNVDILTRDDQILAGSRTTAETLQSATVTSGTSQISGSFLGYLSEGGQAANTVGLRGLGSARTLILLNGRRLAPAGAGPQLVSADLNVLPTSVVQRIEVLREGASSIYGSDAIAGVINIITDSSIDGITIDGFADHPLYGNGDTLRGSITAGKTFSRGHITGSFEYSEDKGLRLGDRPDTRCPRELAFQNGVEVGQGSPTDPTLLRCFPFARGGGGTANGYGIFYNFNNLFQGLPGGSGRITFPGYATGTPNLNGAPIVVNDFNLRPLQNTEASLDSTIISPIKKYTGYLNGSYELGILGDAELYGEALFSRRKSHQVGATQLNFQSQTNPNAQLYGGSYAGTPLEEFGYPVSPFFPTSFAAAGINYFGPFIVPTRTVESKQKVDFWRANGGLRGNLGFGDWRYDGNVQISRTKAKDYVQNPLTSRVGNILEAVLAPSGTPSQFTTTAIPGQTGAGNTYTCAANVTNGAYNGGECVPINFYDPNVVLNGQLPDALFNYLYPTLLLSSTKYRQETFNLAFDGSLFNLQGGAVKAAVGYEHRHDFIDDVPGPERASGDIYGYSTIGRTKGSDKVDEAFAEINIPFFKDRPFANLLEVDASARYTHYKSYGSGFTYHVNGQWAPVAAIRFRGNYGTNFRAPNLYEQFLNNQLGFYSGGLDPCSDFGQNLDPQSTTYQNCFAQLAPILGEQGALNYFSTGSIPVYTTGGAVNNLKAEKAKTYGVGAVFTMPRSIADFTLAVDYWNIKVRNEVGNLGNLILTFCYQAEDFATSPYCALIGPRLTSGNHAGEISSFQNPFLNIARQNTSGIDFDARFAAPVFGGRFTTQLQATRNLTQKLENFEGQGLTDYIGSLGYPGQGAGPKWVGTLDSRFRTNNNITFRWGVKYVGPSDSTKFDPGTFINGQPVTYDLKAEKYFEHGASVQFLWQNVGQFTLGVNNIFNEKPPTISDNGTSQPRIGNFFANGPYDYRGRSIFVNVTRTFKPFL